MAEWRQQTAYKNIYQRHFHYHIRVDWSQRGNDTYYFPYHCYYSGKYFFNHCYPLMNANYDSMQNGGNRQPTKIGIKGPFITFARLRPESLIKSWLDRMYGMPYTICAQVFLWICLWVMLSGFSEFNLVSHIKHGRVIVISLRNVSLLLQYSFDCLIASDIFLQHMGEIGWYQNMTKAIPHRSLGIPRE